MTDYKNLVKALRCKRDDCEGCGLAFFDNDEGWMCQYAAVKNNAELTTEIEALVKRVKYAEELIKLYKGEADLYKDLYRSAREAFLKELYGQHGTLSNLQSLKQSPIPYTLCQNRAEDAYNICANHPEKPDRSEIPNG